MSQIPLQNVPTMPLPTLQPAHLPVAQLESLRSKINSIAESIQMLQATIDQQGQNVMPSWPDILSKYTILLSHPAVVVYGNTESDTPFSLARADTNDAPYV